jgi:hypothetical protein
MQSLIDFVSRYYLEFTIKWNLLLFKHVSYHVSFMLPIIFIYASLLLSISNSVWLVTSLVVCYFIYQYRRTKTILCICYLFLGKSPFIRVFKQQISNLVITISDEIPDESNVKLLADIYNRIFGLFTNLKYLDLDGDDTYALSRPLLTDLTSTRCYSSSIVHLRIKMQNIDDCLYLLDGRLSQLHTLIINLDYIHDPVLLRLRSSKIIRYSLKIMNNLVNNYIRLEKNSFISVSSRTH